MRQTARILSLIFVLIILTAGLLTESLLYSQNILLQHRDWILTRVTSEMPVGFDLYFTRALLAGNQFHPGAWHRSAELVTVETAPPTQIELRFKVADDSFFDLVFNRHDEEFDAVRFNVGSEQILLYHGDSSGRFSERQPISLKRALSRQWHKLQLSRDTSGLRLKLDDDILHLPNVSFSQGAVGVKSGMWGATADSISIQYADHRIDFDLANRIDWLIVFMRLFGICFLLAFLFYLLAWRSESRLVQTAKNLAFVAGLTLIWFSFDFFIWSQTPEPSLRAKMGQPGINPMAVFLSNIQGKVFLTATRMVGTPRQPLGWLDGPFTPPEFQHRVAGNELVWCGSDGSCVARERDEDVPKIYAHLDEPKHGHRVLFIGGSQLFGYGSHKLDETAVVRTHRFLKQSLNPTPIETANYSLALSTFTNILKQYRETLSRFSPDVVIISRLELEMLGSSDAADFEDFLQFNRSRNVRTVVMNRVIRPDCLNKPNICHLPKKEGEAILQPHLKNNDIEVIDPNEWMRQPQWLAGGDLWDDEWHLSSYGQAAFAEWLGPQVLNQLKKATNELKPKINWGRRF